MTRMQIVVTSIAVLLLLGLYLGPDTKPRKQRELEKVRALQAETASVDVLRQQAKSELSGAQRGEIALMEQKINALPEDDPQRIEALKALSGKWYEYGYPALAGAYAQNIAEQLDTEETWSIAGTTYAICLQTTQEERIRNFCTTRAVAAFENAISLNPDNVTHRVNLALCYAENPPQNEPMKGILMLRELNQKQPENVLILNSLARLALRTGQLDRAVERLEEAIAIEPQNATTICLLAQAYVSSGNEAKAATFAQRCEALRNQQ